MKVFQYQISTSEKRSEKQLRSKANFSTFFHLITNNCASFPLWQNQNLVKHQKVSKYYENECRRSHTGHRDKLKQSTADVYRWRYSIPSIDTEHSNTRTTSYNTRRTMMTRKLRSGNNISNIVRTQPRTDVRNSTCILLEKDAMWKMTKGIWK